MKSMGEDTGFIRHGDRRLLMTMLHRHRLAAKPTRQGCPARDYIPGQGWESNSQPRPLRRTDHLLVVAHQSDNPFRAR
jgi:hypothetical protein